MTMDAAGGGVVLHDYWRSSASYRVRIALELKGVAYRRVPVNLIQGQQHGADHRAVNPQGLVPALEIDGQVLTQSLAIIDYLDETRAGHPLLPVDVAARAHVRAIAMAIACEIHPLSNLSVLARVEALAGAPARAAWNQDNIASGLQTVEWMLDHPHFSGRFCHGDTPGMADCVLIPQLYNAHRWDVPIGHLTRVCAVGRACEALPAFAAAHPNNIDPSFESKETQGENT